MPPLSRVRSIDTLFKRLIPALGHYREHVVIVGGMALDLYRFLAHANLDTTKHYLRLVPGHLREDYDKAMPEIATGLPGQDGPG
jgi:hypothetical protein